MSEEEKKAIEYLKQNDIAEIQYDNYGLESIHRIGIDEKYIILNLIEKQQKEIDDLKQLMAHKNGYTKQLEEDLFENASNYVVSKDKIREKIKEYKGLKEIDKMAYEEQIKPLQELLKEE